MATRITFPELLIVNGTIVAVIFFVEKRWGVHYEGEKVILYEKIDLIKPEHYHLLLEDLRKRTGLDVKRCDIQQIDFLRDTAELLIYYDEPKYTDAER